MQPTVFASFDNGQQAEVLVGALLEAGIAPEDISVIIAGRDDMAVEGGAPHLEESHAGAAMVDSGESAATLYGHAAEQTAGSYIYESPIGGGISTSSPDDEVSGVEEMDDSQYAAEQMTYPQNAQSYSSQERFDVAQGANTGFFNTTKPGAEGFGPAEPNESDLPGEDELTSITVPGVGLVLGDGTLATAIVGAGIATERGGNPAADIEDYLTDQLVPKDLAWMLAKDFREGGAVVAIATPPGEADSDVIEQVLEKIGGRNVRMVEAAD